MTNKNVNAQDWLNEKYPVDKVCKRSADKENKNKTRKDVYKLDIQLSNVDSGKKLLFGDLKLTGFTNLRKLTVSNHQLISLDLSDCSNLEELDISYNENIRELDLSKNINLMEVNLNGCVNLKIEEIISHLKFDEKLFKLVEESKIETPISPAEDKIRNILIIGMTGSGKSSLSNTLTNTNDFESCDQTTSVTKLFKQSEPFNWEFNNNHYKFKVIDNIGFGDTKGEDFTEQILYRIGEGIEVIKGEVNQILFLVRGRFDPLQIKMFNLFNRFINESEITKFTTIVITGFENFRNTKKVEEDKEKLLKESKEIKDLIETCNNILYINNPKVDNNKDDDNYNEDHNKILNSYKERSRKIILNHLAENCNQIYKLKEWKSIKEQVSNCLLGVKEINDQIRNTSDQSKINSLEKEKKSTISNFFKNIGKIRAEKVSVKGAVGFNFGIVTTNFELNLENLAVKEDNYNQMIEEAKR